MSSGSVPVDSVRRESSYAALKHPAFQLYFAGQLVSVSGTWMQSVAQQIVVYDLTKSELALGLVACAQGLPVLFLMPFAGVIVDRFPRRQILIVTQSIMMILAFVLALLQFTNQLQVWHIVALSLGLGFANALDAPARQSFVIEMVGKEHLSSGIVLNSIMFNTARIVGPAFGALALQVVGPAWCFFLNGASFLAVIASLFLMVVSPMQSLTGSVLSLDPLRLGFAYAKSHPTIGPIILLSAVTSSLGANFSVLAPVFADQVLQSKDLGTGALLVAQGVGALIAGIVVAQINRSGWRGKLLVVAAICGPISAAALALTTSFYSALPVAAFAGFFFIAQFILMNTLIQTQVPDEFRGRVLSLYTLTLFGLSPFGSLAIGMVGQLLSVVPTLLIFGLLCLIGVVPIVWRTPKLWRLS